MPLPHALHPHVVAPPRIALVLNLSCRSPTATLLQPLSHSHSPTATLPQPLSYHSPTATLLPLSDSHSPTVS